MTPDRIIDRYLSEIAAHLRGPSRTKADILRELRGGLLDATDGYRSTGLRTADAATAAVAEFGDPRQVAAAFGPELTASQARRLTWQLAATAPPIAILCSYAAQASDTGARHPWPWGWLQAPPVPLAAAAVLIAAVAAAITTIATGRRIRCLPEQPRIAAAAAALGGFSAAAVDLAIIALLGIQLIASLGTLSTVPVTAATIASLGRLILARRSARQCLAARAALG
jgi:hypothetical protein